MKIGSWDIHVLDVGSFGLDGGAMFGSVPKAIWGRTNPADEANRITLAQRVMLLDDGDRRILIDTGMGQKWTEKQMAIFRINEERSIDSELDQLGVKREDITDVILTHLHFDHAGGATVVDGNELVPAFSNANYITQRAQWALANNPSQKDAASFIADNFVPLMQHDRLTILDEGGEVAPGVEIIVGKGHTDGHQMVKVVGDDDTMVFMGDTIPTTAHLKLPFIMGYDLRPMETLEEKRKLLEDAVEQNWWLFFDHDPKLAGVKIEHGAKYVEITERYGE